MRRSILALAMLSLAFGAACRKRRPPPPMPVLSAPVAAPGMPASPRHDAGNGGSGDSTAKTSYATTADAPGPAILATQKGTFLLEDGALTRLADESFDGVVVSPAGVAYLNGPVFASILDGHAVRKTPFKRVARGRDGSMWGLTYNAVKPVVEDGGNAAGDEIKLDSGITATRLAVMADGQPVVATYDAVFLRVDGEWKKTPIGTLMPGAYTVTDLFAFRDDVFACSTDRCRGVSAKGASLPAAYAGSSSNESITHVSASGDLIMVDTAQWHFVPAQGSPSSGSAGAAIAGAHTVRSAASDGQGRKWIATDAGAAVLSREGKALYRWPLGTLETRVRKLMVIGAGPTLPDSEAPIAKAPVQGTLLIAGSAAAGTPMVACPEPKMFYTGGHPCAGQAGAYQTKTDANGGFRFEDVLRGDYGFSYKDKKGWVLMGAPCCSQLQNGETVDVGELRSRGAP